MASIVRISLRSLTCLSRVSYSINHQSLAKFSSLILNRQKPTPFSNICRSNFSTSIRNFSEEEEEPKAKADKPKPKPSVDKAKVLESLKTYDQVKAKVEKLGSEFEKLNKEKFNLDAHFINDLGLDSLDQVELVMAMEAEFGFEIPDVEAEKLTRPIDVIKYICAKANISLP